jgi:hypothetical protein
VSEAVKETLFVVDMGIPVKTPITVKVDNIGAVFMVDNATSSTRTCHIDTRWHLAVSRGTGGGGLCEV